MEFFLSVAFLINNVERRFHYQYDSMGFQDQLMPGNFLKERR